MFILHSGNDMDMWNLQYGLLKTNKLLFKETQLLYKLKFKSYQIALLKLLGVLIAYILAYLYTMVSMYSSRECLEGVWLRIEL